MFFFGGSLVLLLFAGRPQDMAFQMGLDTGLHMHCNRHMLAIELLKNASPYK